MKQPPDFANTATQDELLDRHKNTLLGLNEEGLKLPMVVRERALDQTHTLRQAFSEVLSDLEDLYAPKKVQEFKKAFDNLLEYAYLFYAASMAAERPWTEAQKQEFKEQAAKVRDHDARFMKWCRAIAHGDDVANAALDAVSAGKGYIDDAEDTIALTNMLLDWKQQIFPNPFFTEKQVRQAEADARLFLWMLQGRDENKPPKGSPPDMRLRAYNLWLDTYNTLARAGRGLFEDEAEGLRRFPRVSSLKSSPSDNKAETSPSNTPSSRVENFG